MPGATLVKSKKHEQAHKSPAQSHQIINSKHRRAIIHICIVGERTRWTRMMLCTYWVSVVCVCILLSLAQGFRKWLSPHGYRANSGRARFSLAISVFQWLIHHLLQKAGARISFARTKVVRRLKFIARRSGLDIPPQSTTQRSLYANRLGRFYLLRQEIENV